MELNRTCKTPSKDGLTGLLLHFDDTLSEISLESGWEEYDCSPDHRRLKVRLYSVDKQEWRVKKLNTLEGSIEIDLERNK